MKQVGLNTSSTFFWMDRSQAYRQAWLKQVTKRLNKNCAWILINSRNTLQRPSAQNPSLPYSSLASFPPSLPALIPSEIVRAVRCGLS